MTSREATIYHLKQLKGQPLKQQLSYILSNFWIPIVAVLAGILCLVSLITHWTSIKTPSMTLCCLDTVLDEEGTNSYLQGFARVQGIDAEKNPIIVEKIHLNVDAETSYMYLQKFFSLQMAGELDLLITDYDNLISSAYADSFLDLRQALTDVQLEQLADSLLYIDLSVMDQEMTAYPDAYKPEEMEQPVPVAIQLQGDWELSQSCCPNSYEKNVVALFVNGANIENAKALLQYILQN